MAQEPKLESDMDKASYLIGRNIGETISADGIELNVDNMVAGLREALAGKDSRIAEADANKIMEKFQAEMQGKLEAKAKAKSLANVEAGQKFLEENKKREGVTVTESGLQYEVITVGTGDKPTALDTVKVHYHGTLMDGKVFDSSVERKQPAEFQVGGVIAGWTEALQLMPVGSKWKLTIPAKLAYGGQGAGRDIGPHATLIFEVELLSIKGKEKK
ncbi:MAG: FKBP-type peptidyl-prolyl cis-trans isomerase [Roseibacillus sp.]|jgi:FKBP-type peptidyl-prolyl cis-trans isomerase FklB|nr:FKBP-type peptidyl-prolyl cis-trans isomerase [Roseibacillus sp.]